MEKNKMKTVRRNTAWHIFTTNGYKLKDDPILVWWFSLNIGNTVDGKTILSDNFVG